MNGAEMHIPSVGEAVAGVLGTLSALTVALGVWRRASKTQLERKEDADKGAGLSLSSAREKEAYRREQEAVARDQESQRKNASLLAKVEILTSQVEQLRDEVEHLRRVLRKVSPEYRSFVESGHGALGPPEI